ncbi:MAG TPA: hypothetical protein VFX61_04030 [Micromonosporaceae bacterium]|nr:hypothetical protein [Micromonosporaceae bacterium]
MTDQSNDEARGGRPSRRTLFKGAGLAAAAVGASQVLGRADALASPTATATVAESTGVQLEIVDFVDGHYVLAAQGTVAGTALRTPLRMRDGLSLNLKSGGTVMEDPYTGEILLKPAGAGDITVQTMVDGDSKAAQSLSYSTSSTTYGSTTLLASYPGSLPEDELMFDATGGGACVTTSSNPETLQEIVSAMSAHIGEEQQAAVSALDGPIHSQLRVRAAVMGNVIPLSESHRQIRWRHARYYGTHDVLGQLRFTYQQDRVSAATMTRLGGTGFFPARGENVVYCRMEMLDLGGSAFSVDPMVLPNASMNWPIYSTPMKLSKPVVFYDEAAPDREVMTIVENEMALYDYNGVTIKKLGVKVLPSGMLRAAFKVTNQTDAPFTGRWMMIGDHTDATFASTDAALTLGPARSRGATQVIEVNAPIRKRLLSQRVAFAVMSLSDPVVLGITPVTFKFPHA